MKLKCWWITLSYFAATMLAGVSHDHGEIEHTDTVAMALVCCNVPGEHWSQDDSASGLSHSADNCVGCRLAAERATVLDNHCSLAIGRPARHVAALAVVCPRSTQLSFFSRGPPAQV